MPKGPRDSQPIKRNNHKSSFKKQHQVKSMKPKPRVDKPYNDNKLPEENLELYEKVYINVTEKMLPVLVSSGIKLVEAEQICRLFATTVVVRLITGKQMSDDAYAMAYPELSGFDWSVMNTGAIKKKSKKKTKKKKV
tara:strand:- start:435 stop:845 length:411 start_codon:yes stop_codon:yes gene_type:complete